MITISSPNSDKSDPWTSHIYLNLIPHMYLYLEILGTPFLCHTERQQSQKVEEPTISSTVNEAVLEDVA